MELMENKTTDLKELVKDSASTPFYELVLSHFATRLASARTDLPYFTEPCKEFWDLVGSLGLTFNVNPVCPNHQTPGRFLADVFF